MNLLLFIVVLATSFIAVRIGAIAFQLTGIEWSMAKFQALSCFSSTGFTTREAELITATPQRRRIASILIVLGNAGLVTMIATFANSIRPRTAKLIIPFSSSGIPAFLIPFINLVIIIFALYIIYRFFTRSKLVRKFTNVVRARIIKNQIIKPVSFEELSVATGGYGISKIDISSDSPIKDKTIAESGLRGQDITILAIESGGTITPNPPASAIMKIGDKLLCFGKLDNIRQSICAQPI